VQGVRTFSWPPAGTSNWPLRPRPLDLHAVTPDGRGRNSWGNRPYHSLHPSHTPNKEGRSRPPSALGQASTASSILGRGPGKAKNIVNSDVSATQPILSQKRRHGLRGKADTVGLMRTTKSRHVFTNIGGRAIQTIQMRGAYEEGVLGLPSAPGSDGTSARPAMRKMAMSP
jgi:hypothetical protein